MSIEEQARGAAGLKTSSRKPGEYMEKSGNRAFGPLR
jgi:hypothetical protein